MQKRISFLLIISFLTIVQIKAQKLSTGDLPNKAYLLKSLTFANNYFMNEWSDVSKPIWAADRTRPSNI